MELEIKQPYEDDIQARINTLRRLINIENLNERIYQRKSNDARRKGNIELSDEYDVLMGEAIQLQKNYGETIEKLEKDKKNIFASGYNKKSKSNLYKMPAKKRFDISKCPKQCRNYMTWVKKVRERYQNGVIWQQTTNWYI